MEIRLKNSLIIKYLSIFFLLTNMIVSSNGQNNFNPDLWNKLSGAWKIILLKQAGIPESIGSLNNEHLEQIKKIQSFYLDAKSDSKIQDLKGLYFLQSCKSITIKNQTLKSLEGAEYLSDGSRIDISDIEFDINAEAFFKVQEKIQPKQNEIFLGKVKIGQKSINETPRIKEAFVPKRAWVWWDNLTELDRKVIQEIIGSKVNQKNIGNLPNLINLFYQKKIVIDFRKINESEMFGLSLSFLGVLTNLRILELINGRNIKNLTFLRSLSSLDILICENNSIQSLEGIEHLKDLTGIELINNNISNVKAIDKLYELQTFISVGNSLADIKALAALQKLRVLCISRNKIPIDIVGIDKLRNLRSLYLNDNPGGVTGINNVLFPSRLTEVSINNSRLDQAYFLKKCTSLKKVSLRVNQIEDVCFLKDNQDLQYVDLRGNKISDLSCFSELKKLVFIDISENQIGRIDFIESLTRLEVIRADNNKIQTFPENNNTQLKEVRLNNNELVNLMGLNANAGSLQKLSIARQNTGQTVETLPDFSKMKKLEEMNVFDINLTSDQKAIMLSSVLKMMENGAMKKVPCIWF